uniref:Large ribosomal subunit protein uL10 n=1 Tax=Canis lupus familiaris TaxID=9615 RepID=A0A8C0TJ86_CANLF
MLHSGSRQCGFKADAADPHVPPWQGCRADGQEHHDMQGHPRASGEQPSPGETVASYPGNVGFVFTKEDLTEIRDMLLANKVPAAAHAGAIAPSEVTGSAQNTGLGPEKTSFFQALGITTKISRGSIEILSDVQLIKTGDKVGASEATLLNMLNISPFSFGLIIQQGVRNVASVCLPIGYPTVASVPHSTINGYKRVLALSVETGYTFPLAEKVKAFLAGPSAFVAAAPVAAATTAAPAAAAAPAKVEAKRWEEIKDRNTQKLKRFCF